MFNACSLAPNVKHTTVKSIHEVNKIICKLKSEQVTLKFQHFGENDALNLGVLVVLMFYRCTYFIYFILCVHCHAHQTSNYLNNKKWISKDMKISYKNRVEQKLTSGNVREAWQELNITSP